MAVKVTLNGDGLQFSDETTVFNAAQIIGFLKNNEAMANNGGEGVSPPVIGIAKQRVSPREALMNSGAKTNPQKITVLGHYVMQQNGHNSFELDEVKRAFKKAGESLPRNFSRDVKEAVTAGLIYEDEDDEHYVLSDAAQEYVETGFPEAVKRQRSTARKSTLSASKVNINQALLVRLKDKGENLKSYIAARQATYDKRASDQIAIIATWLVDEMGVEGISPADLQAVRRYLGQATGSAASQMSNAMSRDKYFTHIQDGKYYLSSKGEDLARVTSLG